MICVCVCIKHDVKKMKQTKVITTKLAIWWGRNDTFDIGRCKFVKDNFCGGENE